MNNDTDKEDLFQKSVGAETNGDSGILFDGHIILDGGVNGFDNITTNMEAKWSIVDDVVNISLSFPKAWLTLDKHKERCNAKIENVRREEKEKYCPYIDCTTVQATNLCPEQCTRSNSFDFQL